MGGEEEQDASPNLPELSSRLQEVLDNLNKTVCLRPLVEEISVLDDTSSKVKHFFNSFINSENPIKKKILQTICPLEMTDTMDCLTSYYDVSYLIDHIGKRLFIIRM